MLKRMTTYDNRGNANEKVYDLMEKHVGKGRLQKLSGMHTQRRKWMMSKLLTHRNREPGAAAAFDPDTLKADWRGERR
eukprot:11240767-Alexandrium_andersonii.AAC.1